LKEKVIKGIICFTHVLSLFILPNQQSREDFPEVLIFFSLPNLHFCF